MDTSSSSTVTVYDFLDKMRNPASLDLVRAIKSFIVSFSFFKPDPDNDGKRVQEFYSTMEAAFVNHPLWAGASSKEIDSAMEGLEKYVMTKLFHRTFASSPEDAKLDSEISEKIRLLQTFLRPEHLDILQVLWNEGSWLLAEKELLKINAFKAPREKLLCIISCCRVINNLMLNVSISEDHLLGGADVFLPILIYVTIKANPPQLHSNLKFILLFRRQETLVSEPAYYFTNLVSAKSFIIDLKAKSLSIDEGEFEAQMQAAKLSNSCSQAKPSSIPDDITSLDASRDTPSTSMVDRDAGIQHNPRYPYMEAEPNELTVEDVGKLLSLYKDVVTSYTALSKAVGNLNLSRSRTEPSIPIFGGNFNISECSNKENNENKGRRDDE